MKERLRLFAVNENKRKGACLLSRTEGDSFVLQEEVSIVISPFLFAKGLNPTGRDAGRSENGACFRL